MPDDQRSITVSDFSEVNSDRYPLSGNQEHLLKALSRDCEGVAIKYTPCDFLNEYESFIVLVRMTHGTQLYDFLEVPIDCKFVFLLCGSCKGDTHKDVQVCRAFGSLMADKVRFFQSYNFRTPYFIRKFGSFLRRRRQRQKNKCASIFVFKPKHKFRNLICLFKELIFILNHS